jgi:YVTN family beta-propeller protein
MISRAALPNLKCLGLAALSAVIGSMAQAAQPAEPPYHLAVRVPLAGDDRWDYLAIDPAAHRLYVTRGTHVTVFDTQSNSVVGDIPGAKGVHGVALAADLGKAFVSDGKDNAVMVIDLATLKQTARVAVGRNPDAILYEPVTRRVFAFNGQDGTASVIDAASNDVVATLPIGGKLEFAATDGASMVYDNVEDRNELAAIDARTLAVTQHWPLTGCDAPTGLAIDPAVNRLFSACDNGKLAVTDAGTGKVVALAPIGQGPDAVMFDASSKTVITPNGRDGTLSVIHEDAPDRYSPIGTVTTEPGARTGALDPATHRVYLITAKFGDAPAATPDNPHPRPAVVPGSVVLLVYERD